MTFRNSRIYIDYLLRPEFIIFTRLFGGVHLLDLDWLWNITIRETRLDLQTIYAKGKPLIVVLTEVQTGEAIYKVTSAHDLEHVLNASSDIPLFCRDYSRVDSRPTADGGVVDAITVGEAIRRGARRIMVIHSRRQNYVKRNGLFDFFMSLCERCYPLLQQAMAKRVRRYNESVALIRKPPDEISIIEVCPPENFHVSRLSQNHLILQEGS